MKPYFSRHVLQISVVSLQALYLALEDRVFDFQLLDGCVDDIDLLFQLDVLDTPFWEKMTTKQSAKRKATNPYLLAIFSNMQ